MGMTLQDSMDRYVLSLDSKHEQHAAEYVLTLLAEYLLHYSDLFQETMMEEDTDISEWEMALGQHMETLMQSSDESDAVLELGGLPVDALDVEHISDFIGWFLLREPNMDSLQMESCIRVLHAWLAFVYAKGWVEKDMYQALFSMLGTLAPESIRAVKAAYLLFHYVRMGHSASPRIQGERFSRFIEGHARVDALSEQSMQLCFDNSDERPGVLRIPASISEYLRVGDVIDVELGLRGKHWVIVDVGPVYPRYVYMSAEYFDMPDKQF